MNRSYIISACLLLGMLSATADHHEEKSLEESSLIRGTWVRTQTLVEGGTRTWKKEVVRDEKSNRFVETITTTNDDGSVHGHWKLKFHVSRANGPTLVFRGDRMNEQDLETRKWSGWQEVDINYTFQIDEAFWYEFRNLTNKGGLFTYTRVDSGNERSYQKVAARKMAVLEPSIGIFKGSVELIAVESYGIKEGKKDITYTSKWNADKTLITGVWSYDDGSFEGALIYSFNPLKRAIVKNYHTSTGTQMSGVLIGAWNNILLWERSGDTPRGHLYEKCVFDYSQEGVFVHRILERTLNGVPQPQMQDIILKKVSE